MRKQAGVHSTRRAPTKYKFIDQLTNVEQLSNELFDELKMKLTKRKLITESTIELVILGA